METELPREFQVPLSNDLAGRRESRLALIAFLVSIAFFAAIAPFARNPLPHIEAFVPMYSSAIVLSYLITAILLLGQFNVLRTNSLLVLVGGYLFAALVATAQLLAFPGVFAPNGLFGGPQNAAWLWIFWHAGFPLVVLLYALVKTLERPAAVIATDDSPAKGIGFVTFVASATALAAALVCVMLAQQDFLPDLILNGRYAPGASVAWGLTWGTSVFALTGLWRRRPHTMLDIWLIVVVGAWLFDILVSTSFNGARYDVGWYAGRLYGLGAAACLLGILLIETGKQASDLAKANRRTFELLQIRTVERDSAQDKRDAAVATNIIMDEFVATASHELRTPLTAIAASMALLAAGSFGAMPPAAARLIKIAHLNTQRMVRLINDILDIAKIDAGKMQFELAPVSLRAVAEQAIEGNRAFAANYNAVVELDAGAELCWVSGDADRLMQIMTNLLSNAVKFSPPGAAVTVSIEQFAGMGRVTVRDRGIGIPVSFRPRIFEKFAQADATDTRQRGGTGLGLSIVQKIVVRHGGTINFESAPGGGTVFLVEIPLWKTKKGNQPKAPGDSPPRPESKTRAPAVI
jgi:signal transduction histidine kinase